MTSMKLAQLAWSALAATILAGFAAAQSLPPPPPLPPGGAAPPPLPPLAGDPELEPQVTIIRRDAETHEEVRIGGELKFVRVTPQHGRPYYLVPDAAGLQFTRRDSLDISLKVPLWVLFSW